MLGDLCIFLTWKRWTYCAWGPGVEVQGVGVLVLGWPLVAMAPGKDTVPGSTLGTDGILEIIDALLIW